MPNPKSNALVGKLFNLCRILLSFDWKFCGTHKQLYEALNSPYAFFRGKGHVEYEAMHLKHSLGLLLSALWLISLNAYHIFLFQIIKFSFFALGSSTF